MYTEVISWPILLKFTITGAKSFEVFPQNLHIILRFKNFSLSPFKNKMKVTNYYIIRVFLHFKISGPCLNREKVKIINQNIIWRWRNYFKTFCVCERKFHKNLSRNDLMCFKWSIKKNRKWQTIISIYSGILINSGFNYK